jgi:hypothetical protein
LGILKKEFVKKDFKNSYHKPLFQIATQEKGTMVFVHQAKEHKRKEMGNGK